MAADRRRRAPWQRLLRAAAWLPALVAHVRGQVLNFGIDGLATVKDTIDVVEGEILVGIGLNWESIAEFAVCVKNALQAVAVVATPIILTTWQSVDNFESNFAQLNMEYSILPHKTQNADLVRNLVDAGRGGPFQDYLMWQVKQNPRTKFIDTTKWEIRADPPVIVSSVRIVRPSVMPDVPRSQTEALSTALETSGEMALLGCSTATSGCMCAAMVGCLWQQNATGVFKCSDAVDKFALADVPCLFCSAQAKCVPGNVTTVCGRQTAACSCATSLGDCIWDVGSKSCKPRVVAYTSCDTCAEQDRCGPPVIQSVAPVSGSLAGIAARRRIELRFDRQVRYTGKEGDIVFQCWSPNPEVGQFTRTVMSSMLELQGPVLRINASAFRNPVAVPCTLAIKDRTFRSGDNLWFKGMLGNDRYSFTLGDNIMPTLAAAAPALGEVLDGELPTALQLNFSEPVRLSFTFLAELMIIRNGRPQLLKKWDGQNAEGVVLLEQGVQLDVSDVQAWGPAGTVYSLVLHLDAIADTSGNLFAGLALGAFVFSQSIESSPFVVSFSIPMKNIDREFLMDNEALLTQFLEQVKQAVANAAGADVAAESVEVTVAVGPTLFCKVAVPTATATSEVHQKLLASGSTLAADIAQRVSAIQGIEAVTSGTVTVGEPSQPVVEETNAPPKRAVTSAVPCRAKGAWHSLLLALAAAAAERSWRPEHRIYL